MSEQQIHQTIAAFLSRALPSEAWHCALDHAGKQSYLTAARLKARGAKRGLPDHICLIAGHPAIFFEVKTDKGRLSPEQEQTASAIIGNGQHWFLVRSPDDVEAALRSINVPLRATLGEIHGRIAEQNARIKPARKRSGGGFGGGGGSKARVRKGAAIYAAVLLK